MRFSSRQLKRSFSFAFSGLRRVLHEEQNFRLQMTIGLLVVIAMFFFDLSGLERAILTLAIAFILVLELMNSIFERVADLLKPRVHMHVQEVKDIMAGTVLLASVAAILVGLLILWPHLANELFG